MPVLARFCIGKDDFSEEAISASGISFLLSTLGRVNAILGTPLPEVKDWLSASVALCRRYTLGLANIYLVWTAFFLACDRRSNPKSPVALDTARAFDVDACEFPLRLECLAKATAFISPLLKEPLPCEFLASELRTLQLSAAAFFGVLESVFGLHSVADVWRINEAKWAKVSGTFATERDLRSACYNIAEKADGGVSFNFRR